MSKSLERPLSTLQNAANEYLKESATRNMGTTSVVTVIESDPAPLQRKTVKERKRSTNIISSPNYVLSSGECLDEGAS